MPRPAFRVRIWPDAVGFVALLLLAGGVTGYFLTRPPGNLSDPSVEFDTGSTAALPPPVPADDDGFSWPLYGRDKARTRYLPVDRAPRPPLHKTWRLGGPHLLEFPPVVCGKWLFIIKNTGSLYSVRRSDGYVRWTENLGRLAASSPACDRRTVYAVILQRGRSRKSGGRIAALDAKKGTIRWSRRLASRSESSPLLDRGTLFFGSESGRIYALNARTGALKWTYDAGGAVKGALSLAAGKLYFGDYSGRLTALRRDNGRKLWRVKVAAGGTLGVGEGNIYSTPAAAYGRVYVGSTNGFVYSVSQRNGRLAWRHRTKGYVYSSPAVGPAGGGTVYIGSYDGKLYALNARTGAVRWKRDSGGKLSGGVTVIGDTVLYANLRRRSIAAVGAATGRLIWSFDRGGFDPGISDGEHYYLLGYSSVYMLENTEEYRRQRDARK